MKCQQLFDFLHTKWLSRKSRNARNTIAAHIRSCPICRRSIEQLTAALIGEDALTCDQCRAHFPSYYEATRPECPLVTMPEADMIEVAIHLGHCTTCAEEYAVLVELWSMEENNGDL